jgi:hypothetical protein
MAHARAGAGSSPARSRIAGTQGAAARNLLMLIGPLLPGFAAIRPILLRNV